MKRRVDLVLVIHEANIHSEWGMVDEASFFCKKFKSYQAHTRKEDLHLSIPAV